MSVPDQPLLPPVVGSGHAPDRSARPRRRDHRRVLRHRRGDLVQRIASDGGRAIAVSTDVGSGVYNLTKFGVTAFSEALRQEAVDATELQSHNSDEVQGAIEKMLGGGQPLTAEDMADAIALALRQPEHVGIDEILVRPLKQRR